MKTIAERAREYAKNEDLVQGADGFEYCLRDYIKGATEQKAIDIEKAKTAFGKACGWLSTYPWYNEVFEEFIKALEEEL